MNILDSLKSRASSGSKERYELNEILLIMTLKNEEYSYKQISEVVGRTANSLVYLVRKAKSFESISKLFTHFGQVYKDEQDVAQRVEAYKDQLEQQVKKTA